MNKRTLIIASIGLALCCADPAFAVSTLALFPVGDSAYELRGAGIEAAAGFELTILYDTTTLSNPRVTQGGLAAGAMTAVNAAVPGSFRMALVRTTPVTGSGVLAAITFDRVGGRAGRITALNVRLADSAGRSIPVLTQVNNPAPADTGMEDASPAETARSSGSTVQTPVPSGTTAVTGVILYPQDPEDGNRPEKEKKAAEESLRRDDDPAMSGDPSVSDVDTAKRAEGFPSPVPEASLRKIHAYMSVLERFRNFRGKATMQAFCDLFDQENMIGFRQEPPVALADGKQRMRVTFISTPGDRSASDIALMGGRLVSLGRDRDYTNTWIAEVAPAKGSSAASISVSQGDRVMVYPLTVALFVDIDLDGSGSVTEDDFMLFLRDRGAPKHPRFDLNGDRKRDYLDDYLFTSNYLAIGSASGRTAMKRERR